MLDSDFTEEETKPKITPIKQIKQETELIVENTSKEAILGAHIEEDLLLRTVESEDIKMEIQTVERDIKSTVPISLHHNKTKPTEFKILKKLAKGGYGEVYVVEKDKKTYAMKKVNKNQVLKNQVGSPDYVSPDVLSSAGEYVIYGTEVDFWSIGVVLYEMFYGVPPFYADRLKETYAKIDSIDYTFPDGISPELKDLISNLLCKNDKRFTFDQMRAHCFFDGIDWDNLREQEPFFKPVVSSDEDISNFSDSEFFSDNFTVPSGFLNFVGFTYDPDHVSSLVNLIIESNIDSYNKNVLKNDILGCNLEDNEGRKIKQNDEEEKAAKIHLENMKEKQNKKELEDLKTTIEHKQHELLSLKSEVNKMNRSREELSSQVSSLNSNLSKSIEQISHRKDHLEQLKYEINNSMEQLDLLKVDISEKMKFVGEINKKNSSLSHEAQEDLKDLKKAIQRCKFNEKLDEIQQSAYWLYKQNTNLHNELKALSCNDSANKSLDDLKKQLRLQKSEIREYEQKVETEMVLRQKVEEEVKSLKKALREAQKTLKGFTMSCINANNNKEMQITAESGAIFVDEKQYLINSVYIRDLKNNEMHHLSYKKRGLCVLLFFLVDPLVTSSVAGSRRSLKALEADLKKEQSIYNGIVQLLTMLDGKTRVDAINQRKGAMKKIEQLLTEIEIAKKSTVTEYAIPDDENVYEFNSHIFYEKTVAKGSLCDYCNEMLYGMVNQAYCCKDCLLVVHKSCYVLVDISCELNKAIKAG
ncbi:uncharacterized protein LOC143922044 [Arctopsyche grandis]|uniref:uncharacterized protein LOC143922044 n=1 Tax=Arctopsyche grandis TaxID=121162 RepID=UPI00406D7835